MSETKKTPPRIRVVVIPRATPMATILPVTGYFAAWTIGLYFLDAYALQMALQILFLVFVPLQLLLQWLVVRAWYRALKAKKTQRIPQNKHLINSALIAATLVIVSTVFGLQGALLTAGQQVRHELAPILAADVNREQAKHFYGDFERVWHDAIVRAFSGDPSTSQAEVDRLELRLQTFAKALEDQSISQAEMDALSAAFASTATATTAAVPVTVTTVTTDSTAPTDLTTPSPAALP